MHTPGSLRKHAFPAHLASRVAAANHAADQLAYATPRYTRAVKPHAAGQRIGKPVRAQINKSKESGGNGKREIRAAGNWNYRSKKEDISVAGAARVRVV